MSAASPAKLDLKSLADEFRNLSPNDVGAWPLLPRVAVLLGLFVAILAAARFEGGVPRRGRDTRGQVGRPARP